MADDELRLETRWGQLTQSELEQMEAIMARPPKEVDEELLALFTPEALKQREDECPK